MATVSINKSIRLINLGKTESWKTQAVYHALAERMTEDSQDTIIICQPDTPYLSLGHFQSFNSIFDYHQVKRLNLPVYSRRIGGGATYLDCNQLFYQFIFHHSRVPVFLEKAYKKFLAAPVETLKSFGLDCNLRALNEIEVNGKRIAGIGGGRIGDAAVIVGNFLFDFDYEAMSSVWKSPWSGFNILSGEAIKERIYTLKQCAPDLSVKEVFEKLIGLLPNYFNRSIKNDKLTTEENDTARNELEKLTVKITKNKNNEESEIQKKPLKISADVFIHNRKIAKKGHSFNFSFRTDKEIVTRVKAENVGFEKICAGLVNMHQGDVDKVLSQASGRNHGQ